MYVYVCENLKEMSVWNTIGLLDVLVVLERGEAS